MKITGTIVTYNNMDTIKECIASIREFSNKYALKLYVVDNGSTDGTVEWIRKFYPEAELIINQQNAGFGRAHNQVLPLIESDFHFVINPDIYLREDAVSKLVEYLESDEKIGIATPQILNSDGSIQFLPKREPRLRYILASKIPLFRWLRKRYTMESDCIDKPAKIEFCTGCFFCVKTRLMKRLGGFDDRFFMYFEDADLSRRAARYNKIMFYPEASVYHCWRRENTRSLKGIVRYLRSMALYFNKWGWKL